MHAVTRVVLDVEFVERAAGDNFELLGLDSEIESTGSPRPGRPSTSGGPATSSAAEARSLPDACLRRCGSARDPRGPARRPDPPPR